MVTDSGHGVKRIEPGSFDHYLHGYPKALNATIHPMVSDFLRLDHHQIAKRYGYLHPEANTDALVELLVYQPAYYRWAGADLINVTNEKGVRQMVVIENNSCPSGQKSMPLPADHALQQGYWDLMAQSFKPFLDASGRKKGVLAVFYDKNFMETSGYAAAMADVFQEAVFLVTMKDKHNPHIRFHDSFIEIRTSNEQWIPVSAAFRYVTQKPWNRLPMDTSTRIYNPIVACLAGGRNKLMAAKAYQDFNKEWRGSGLKIRMPETIRNVRKKEVPDWVRYFGGRAVVKIPYSNAGQGVYTIINPRELKAFMKLQIPYEKLIVQSLIGNSRWNQKPDQTEYYQIGTLPDRNGDRFVFDLRMMICSTPAGFRPVSLYSRRAELPIPDKLSNEENSWSILGTNLSRQTSDGEWTTDTSRLMLMDNLDFSLLGLGLDDLAEAYVQAVLSTVAIDRMAAQLISADGSFKSKRFAVMNPDKILLSEIMK